MSAFNGVHVIAATLFQQRHTLGEKVTEWLEDAAKTRPGFQLVDIVVRQSSDQAYHCLSVVIFYRECVGKDVDSKTSATADISSKVKTSTSARTAMSNADAAEILRTNASASAPKKNR